MSSVRELAMGELGNSCQDSCWRGAKADNFAVDANADALVAAANAADFDEEAKADAFCMFVVCFGSWIMAISFINTG